MQPSPEAGPSRLPMGSSNDVASGNETSNGGSKSAPSPTAALPLESASSIYNDTDHETPYYSISPEDRRLLALSRPPPRPIRNFSSGQIESYDSSWGLPPDPGLSREDQVDPSLHARLAQFHTLKDPPPSEDPSEPDLVPTHFNASLLANRSFRNPHLYEKLVRYLGIQERQSGYQFAQAPPPEVAAERGLHLSWGGKEREERCLQEGDPKVLDALQKRYTDERLASQRRGGGRSKIDFSPASSSKGGEASRSRPYSSSGSATSTPTTTSKRKSEDAQLLLRTAQESAARKAHDDGRRDRHVKASSSSSRKSSPSSRRHEEAGRSGHHSKKHRHRD